MKVGQEKIAGLEEGDVISAIDGEDITDDEVSDVAGLIRNSDKDSAVLDCSQRERRRCHGDHCSYYRRRIAVCFL